MKKAKTIQKPSFKKMLLKRIVTGFIITLVLLTSALITASIVYKNYIYDKGQDRAIERLNYIESKLDDFQKGKTEYHDINSFIIDINSYMISEACYESVEKKPYIACRMLDKDKKVIADTSQLMKLQVNDYYDPDTFQSVYLCHPDVYDDVYAAVMQFSKQIDERSGDGKEYGVFVYQAYLDGKYFYPRLSLRSMNKEDFYNNANAPDEWKEWKEEEAIEFYPKDTGSMRYVEYKDKKMMLYFTAYEDYSDSAVESTLDEYINGDMFKEGKYKNVFVFKYPFYPPQQTAEPQPEYTLVCAFPYSFIGRFPLLVSVSAVGAFFVTLLIVFISARISCTDRKAQYEIFTARQETTNAMAHDLKTPLTSIAGYTEMLQSDMNPEKQKHYLSMISKNVEQMNNIITDILDLAKSEAGAKLLDTEEISVEDICRQSINDLSGAFETNQLTCELDVQKNAVIKADKTLFTQALNNLLHNASVYSKPGTSVTAILTDKFLRIENTPEHMPKLSAEELVKPFVKDNSYRGENSGSGVGLAIAKQDLERMGFEMKIEMKDDRFIVTQIF